MTLLAAIPLWRTRGPRFLLLLIMGWIAVRSAANWPDPSEFAQRAGQPIAALQSKAVASQRPELPAIPARAALVPAFARVIVPVALATRAIEPAIDPVPTLALPSVWTGPDRHRWRMAMLMDMMPRTKAPLAAFAVRNPQMLFPAGAAAPPPAPLWPAQTDNRWVLSSYALWRPGGRAVPALATGGAATLGGSQMGVRADYILVPERGLRSFVRVTASPVGTGNADLAVGLSARLVAHPPVDLHLEQRFGVAGGGIDRTLAYVTGGVDDRPLAHGFQLSAYAQAGVAGPERAEAFVDGVAAIQRPVYAQRGLRLSVGAMVAGAAQRGAARLDIGPRATVHLPDIGEGASIAVDWRERIAGHANPTSGIAVTLAAGF
jgi:hypothetical protein